MIKKLFLINLLLFNVIIQTSLHAQEISVVTEHLPPYQTYNNNGQLTGYSTDVIKAIFKITGDKAKIKVYPWARAYSEALEKNNVLIYSIARTKPRELLFHWVGDLFPLKIYVLGLKSKFKVPFNSIADIKPYELAVSKSNNSGQYITTLNYPNVYYPVDELHAIKMLFANRTDLIIGNKTITNERAEHLNLDFSQLQPLLEIEALTTVLCIAFSKNTEQAILDRFRQAFKKLKTSGKLLELQHKWQINDVLI